MLAPRVPVRESLVLENGSKDIMAASNPSTTLSKPAESASNLHPHIRERWSPRSFRDAPVSLEDLWTLLEAARWAPSSSNEQPWRFIVGRKEDKETFAKVLSVLVEGNQAWAKNAPVLLLAVAKKTNSKGAENRWAWHDVGLALGSLVFQATAIGLHVHMMAGFDADKAREVFHIPEGYEATTAAAVGYLGDPNALPERLKERELAPRQRKPIEEIAFRSDWGRPAFTSDSD
jgi:nitroreductase